MIKESKKEVKEDINNALRDMNEQTKETISRIDKRMDQFENTILNSFKTVVTDLVNNLPKNKR